MTADPASAPQPCAVLPGGAPRSGPRRWQEADGEHIDVRGLQPPQPLVDILRLVQQMAGRGVVLVHHDRDPVLLYPELAELGWSAERLASEPGELLLRLTPGA